VSDVLLDIVGLSKRFGGLVVTDNVHLSVRRGETHAIIGPNGAGKTTLINQLQGELRPDAGRILFEGTDITATPAHARAALGLARTFQITSIFPEMTVLENVALAAQVRLGHSFRFLRAAATDAALIAPARGAIEQASLAGRTHDLAAALSHGERRQLEIAMAIAMRPKLLLLDEPTAGMGRQDSARIAELLKSLKQYHTLVLVEHDMQTVFALADRLSVLVSGRVIASGPPDAVRADPAVRAAYLGHTTQAA
jgi:branched-chain amino acid transport system ATP-binding protein